MRADNGDAFFIYADTREGRGSSFRIAELKDFCGEGVCFTVDGRSEIVVARQYGKDRINVRKRVEFPPPSFVWFL